MTKSLHKQRTDDTESAGVGLRALRQRIVQPLRFVSFWIAIALPFVHVPLLMTGLSTVEQVLAFAGLVTVNLIAIALGHAYQPE